MAVNEHRYKVAVRDTESSPGIPDRGWVNMDVRWLITKDSVGASKTVFGVTYFPAGSKHDIHRHPNAEEVEYLVSGSGIAYVGDEAIELGPGEAVLSPRTNTTASRTTRMPKSSWRGTTRVLRAWKTPAL